ncbi:MAG: Ig-like domain-containing protein, partial [Longimicrobiales bacterium]
MRLVATPARLLVAGVILAACARPLAPTGGEQDQTPPRIVATTPAEREVVTDTDLTVAFEFDERISERGVRESILVSPSTGVPRVEKGRSEIRVRMPGGWRAGEVYRVVLLPGVRDLFGNETREPASLVFSTGPPVPSTAIGGLVVDRITG